jgi:hypothetical protein
MRIVDACVIACPPAYDADDLPSMLLIRVNAALRLLSERRATAGKHV